MAVYIHQGSRIITQGITGRAGRFFTERCLGYAAGRACFVAGVNPAKAGGEIFGLPIYASVREAAAATGATVSVIYVPPPAAAGAILEAAQAGLALVVCPVQGIPVKDMLHVRAQMRAIAAASGRHTLLLGPGSPGVISPGQVAAGIMPAHIHKPGRVGIVSHSGTLAWEAAAQLGALGLGQSSAVGLGAEPVGGLGYLDVLQAFHADADTDAVVMLGSAAGRGEIDAALWWRQHMRKPLVAYIAGAASGDAAAAAKLEVLRGCGAAVTGNPSEIGHLARQALCG